MFRELVPSLREYHRTATTVAAHPRFLRFGFSDCSILQAARRRTLLTDDLPLYLAAEQQGVTMLNFTHARSAAGTV